MADEQICSTLSRMIVEVNHDLIFMDVCSRLGFKLATFEEL